MIEVGYVLNTDFSHFSKACHMVLVIVPLQIYPASAGKVHSANWIIYLDLRSQ